MKLILMCVCVALLQITAIPISSGLPSLVCYCLIAHQEVYSQDFIDPSILCDNDESNPTVLINRQPQVKEDIDTKISHFYQQDQL